MRKNIGLGVHRTLFQHHADNLRNHVAGALHDHRVANAHILARNFVLIVQRRIGDDDAADRHRIEPRHRRQRAGAPDLDFDVAQDRAGGLFGGEFMRVGPAWRARDKAKALLKREVVDLVDHAVDVVAQVRAAAFDIAEMRQHFLAVLTEDCQWIDHKAEIAEGLHHADLRVGRRDRDLAPGVSEKSQRPPRRHARIELAQRSGRRIARIGERSACPAPPALFKAAKSAWLI